MLARLAAGWWNQWLVRVLGAPIDPPGMEAMVDCQKEAVVIDYAMTCVRASPLVKEQTSLLPVDPVVSVM